MGHWRLAALFAALLTICPIAQAQEKNPAESAASSAAADSTAQDQAREKMAANLAQIAEYQGALSELTAMRATAESTRQEILDARISRALDQLITLAQSTARTYIAARPEGSDKDASGVEIIKLIDSLPNYIGQQLAYIQRGLELPKPTQTALEQAALIADLEVSARKHDKLIDSLIANNAIAAEMGMDTRAAERSVSKQIVRGAENASAYLDVTMDQLGKLRRQLATLPRNEELIAKIAVTEKHMLAIADILRKRAKRMDELGLDTSPFNAQLIAATGAITTEIFDLNVITGIATDFFDSITDWLSDNGARITFQFVIFLIILGITWKVAAFGEIITKRALGSMKVSLSQLLQRMIISATRSIILVLGLLIGLSQLGISLGPLLAGLGIAGFIIGFALQDSLSNFASGLMILIYRPFDVGDVVDVNGAFGTVRHMSLVNTTVLTFDNQTLVVPNNQVWQNIIKNLTSEATRRVDLMFGISYADDIDKAERVLQEIVSANSMVLSEPEATIRLHQLGESSVNFVVRPWVKTEDYWNTYWAITREVKLRFDREGISIPFPQRDVHLYTREQPV
jgi:small conductance mechanosensitive channel